MQQEHNNTIQQQIRCVSHEIRNQLSICDVYSEILKKNIAKENIKNSSIDNAISCIQKAIKLIGNNLIDLKSFDNCTPHVVDADKLTEECIELSKVYIQDKEIEIISQIETGTKIYVDENKFQGCLINIIKNAIEAIDNKGIIKVISEKSSTDKLSIRISNSGKPIPASKQTEIFTQGFTTKKTGSGVGLYLCKKNLNNLNGDITLIKSVKGETEFEITIPIKHIS